MTAKTLPRPRTSRQQTVTIPFTSSEEDFGEVMTREIESEHSEMVMLRRARRQARDGRVHSQAELDQVIADQG